MSKSEFKKYFRDTDSARVVVFETTWCGYCKRFLEQAKLVLDHDDSSLTLVDADSEDGALWEEYKLSLVPTIIVLKGEKEIFRRNGRAGIGLVKNDLETAIAMATKE